MPWHRFRIGSPVLLSADETDGGEVSFGVVSKRSQQSVEVAVEDWPAGDRFRLDLSADEVTRARQLIAMNAALVARGRFAQLRDVLLGEREPRFNAPLEHEFAAGLNPTQQAAVQFALSAHDIAIIHGPPGTGKTTTGVELARQAVLRGEKVLACAPSNTAVDNLLERLAFLNLRVVRIGHPARVQEDLQSHTLEALVENEPGMDLVRDMFRDAEKLARQAGRFTRARPLPGARQNLRQEVKLLRDDARRLEKQIVAGYLDNADIVCATTTLDPEVLGDRHFDLTIIDEACQSTEPGCWPVVARTDRLVLAGDHCQLPPTVLSVPAAEQGFAISLMERLVKHYGDRVTRQLEVQYRMHAHIMQFSSGAFYHDSLVADPSVATHLLCDLPHVDVDALTDSPLMLVDTAGANWDEEPEPDGESRRNPQEGRLVLKLAERLCTAGLKPSEIAIIAPYAAQVRWLREHCGQRDIEIDTVDGFQGREKEAVLISLVRSNATGEIGFLADTRRMNVAITRARRKLIVVGDSATLGGHPFYDRLLEYFEQHAAYHTVWEEELSD
jgi:superfamily I DNA and/or RNA helicase